MSESENVLKLLPINMTHNEPFFIVDKSVDSLDIQSQLTNTQFDWATEIW